jgi:hypothetical protein
VLSVETGVGAINLGRIGIEIDKAREAIDSVLDRNERIMVEQIIPTSRAKVVIEIAIRAAVSVVRLSHDLGKAAKVQS